MDVIEMKVRDWDARMRSFPDFDEIRDVEFVRRSGRINMITENVQAELYRRGRYAGVLWLERCRAHKVSWQSHYKDAVEHYTKQHGPIDSWFSSGLLDAWTTIEIDEEERRLRARLAEIEAGRNAKPR